MTMLADSVEVVIGVDTHKQTHTAAGVATATGHTTVTMTVPASAAGYQRLLSWPTSTIGGGCGRSRGLGATAPA